MSLAGNELSIAGHGRGRSVEHSRLLETASSSLGPVPVGLSALVAALVLESLLVLPGEVPVPRQEGTSVVDLHGLQDVVANKVIEARLCSWDE